MLIKQAIRDRAKLRNTFGDKIIITDEIRIYEGTKLKFVTKGHIVDKGLIQFINFLAYNNPAGSQKYCQSPAYNWTAKTSYMRVGTGASVTTHGTTALSTVDATAPSSQTGATSQPTAGSYRVAYTATWNAGAIAALVVTEIGLTLNALGGTDTLTAFGTEFNSSGTTQVFFSRISEADGDFAHFTINVAVPLTIQWNITFSFA